MIRAALALFLVALVPDLAAIGAASARARGLYHDGLEDLRAERMEEATRALEAAVQDSPEFVDAL